MSILTHLPPPCAGFGLLLAMCRDLCTIQYIDGNLYSRPTASVLGVEDDLPATLLFFAVVRFCTRVFDTFDSVPSMQTNKI